MADPPSPMIGWRYLWTAPECTFLMVFEFHIWVIWLINARWLLKMGFFWEMRKFLSLRNLLFHYLVWNQILGISRLFFGVHNLQSFEIQFNYLWFNVLYMLQWCNKLYRNRKTSLAYCFTKISIQNVRYFWNLRPKYCIFFSIFHFLESC